MASEARWATAVRVLALCVVGLVAVAVLEAVALRRARADVQRLRDERTQVEAGIMSAWARQSADEVAQVIRGVNDFYEEPTEGFGRAGGLCAGGRLNEEPLATYLFGTYLPARGAGKSVTASVTALRAAMQKSDAYRAVHPDRTPSAGAK